MLQKMFQIHLIILTVIFVVLYQMVLPAIDDFNRLSFFPQQLFIDLVLSYFTVKKLLKI